MPEKKTIQRARKARLSGKAPTSQAGEFIREEIHHIRRGKHGARSPKQAIAIGLSKARKAGIKLPPPPAGSRSAEKVGAHKHLRPQNRPSAKRSHAILRALRREPHFSASPRALSAQTRRTARERGPRARHLAAVKAIRTKGRAGLKRAGKKAAHTRYSQAA